MVDSGRAHAKDYFPELLLPVSLSPHEPQPPPASAEDPPILAGRSGSVYYGVTAPSCWVLMHTLLCVSPPRVESLFPQFYRSPAIKFRWPSMSDSLGIPHPVARPPGSEACYGSQNLHSSGWTSVV